MSPDLAWGNGISFSLSIVKMVMSRLALDLQSVRGEKHGREDQKSRPAVAAQAPPMYLFLSP